MYTHTYIHTSMYLYICVYCVYIYIYLSIYLSKGLKKRVLLRALPGISSYDRYFHLYILLCLHLNTYIYNYIFISIWSSMEVCWEHVGFFGEPYGLPWRSLGGKKHIQPKVFLGGGQFFAVQRSSGT